MIERAAYDAIVLAGGRGSRLGGVDKGSLVVGGRTLLQTALDAVADARRVVVVGAGPVPAGVLPTREQPAFGGPAAGVVAGLRALPGGPAAFVVLLACDLPGAVAAVELLRRTVDNSEVDDSEVDGSGPADGWCLAEADGRLQWLCGVYRAEALERAAAVIGDAHGVSMGRLLRPLSLRGIPAGPELTADIDTPTDLDQRLT